jgi:hypothetical protein
MSTSQQLLLKNGQPFRIVSDDTNLPDVIDYYEAEYGDVARTLDFSMIEVPGHPDL